MDIRNIRKEMEDELVTNILPFWINKMTDQVNGGFYGRITGENVLVPEAEKGAILNARILWTFSAAYRLLQQQEYLTSATRAKRYIIDYFYDKDYGGIYWSLDYKGNPLNTKKQIYAISFAIYGLSEYYRATGDEEALDYAIRLFRDIEQYSFDSLKNGYYEALTREWEEIADMRLSEKDENERKTMNTHLHILEAYANLYRVWKDDYLKQQLRNLIELFINKILNTTTGHLDLFFNDEWNSKYHIVSYGHDIEASWLIYEAVLVLEEQVLLEKVRSLIGLIAAAADEGLTADGAMIYESFGNKREANTDRHWWVQAENVVGHVNLYQYFNDEKALQKAFCCWEFIKKNLVDHENGEWYWSVHTNGAVDMNEDKAGFWKCPYHNGRMCMEVMERFSL